jgi:hypothetical protein
MGAISVVAPEGSGLYKAPVASKTSRETSQPIACTDPEGGGTDVRQYLQESADAVVARQAGEKFVFSCGLAERAANHARGCPVHCPQVFGRMPSRQEWASAPENDD